MGNYLSDLYPEGCPKGVGIKEKLAPRQAAHSSGVGYIGEEKFLKECLRRGFEVVDRRKWAKFDFIVNRKLVEVKASSRRFIDKKKEKKGWNFTLEHNVGHFDFVACYCQQEGRAGKSFWLILPLSEVTKTGFYFTPQVEKNAAKFAPFIDRWDLLV